MPLYPISIDGLSNLRCTFTTPDDPAKRVPDILIVSFEGEYGYGSLGNPDATFITAKTMAAMVAVDPSCLILDFSGMSYQWGDALLRVFESVGRYCDEPDEPRFPVLVVTSDKCRDALMSLLGTMPEKSGDWHFDNLDAAIEAARAAAHKWLEG